MKWKGEDKYFQIRKYSLCSGGSNIYDYERKTCELVGNYIQGQTVKLKSMSTFPKTKWNEMKWKQSFQNDDMEGLNLIV